MTKETRCKIGTIIEGILLVLSVPVILPIIIITAPFVGLVELWEYFVVFKNNCEEDEEKKRQHKRKMNKELCLKMML